MYSAKHIVSATLPILFVSSVAFAGKPERDAESELAPKVEAAQNDLKAACGCDVSIKVDYASYANARDMARISHALTNLVAPAKESCAEPVQKKAFCEQIKSYSIKYAKSPDASLNGDTLECTTNSNAYCSPKKIQTLAYAEKPRLDKIREITPKVEKAAAALKSACGCDVAVNVVFDGYKSDHALSSVRVALETGVQEAKRVCAKPVDKKAFCENVKRFEVKYDEDAAASLDAGTVTCGSAHLKSCSPKKLRDIVEKF